MKNIPEFLTEGLIRFNDGIYPDSKLTALRVGLQNYYETYSISVDGFYDYFHVLSDKVILTNIKGHGYMINYYSSIIFFHLSFEQFIIEILETISPVLSRLTITKELDLVMVLCGNIESATKKNKNNVDYLLALNRIEELIKNRDQLPQQYKIDPKYDFLLEGIKTLKTLASLRNDVIHSGKEILNRYFYDCFFVNELLPLTRKYINTQKSATLIERNLACGKNVIDEICTESLPVKYKDISKYNELEKALRRINHFKELGRASFHNPIHMFENVQTEEQKEAIDEYNKPKKEQGNLHARFRQEILKHFKIHKCPCCGANSLTNYDPWTTIADNKTRAHKAECALCTYKISINLGEPKEFGIMNEEIFSYLPKRKKSINISKK